MTERYGLLTVVGRERGSRLRCVCACGAEVVRDGGDLRRGNTRSCGARQHRRQDLGPGRALRNLLSVGKINARRRGLLWHLTDAEWLVLIGRPCVYCGQEPDLPAGYTLETRGRPGSVDRLDSSLGYTPDNTVPACAECNGAKSDRQPEAYLAHAIRVAHHFVKEHVHE